MCGTGFIVPRTEWLEWWVRHAGEPVPFIRRGCSWACFPDTDDDDDDDDGRLQRVGWQSGKEVEETGGRANNDVVREDALVVVAEI